MIGLEIIKEKSDIEENEYQYLLFKFQNFYLPMLIYSYDTAEENVINIIKFIKKDFDYSDVDEADLISTFSARVKLNYFNIIKKALKVSKNEFGDNHSLKQFVQKRKEVEIMFLVESVLFYYFKRKKV